MARDLGLIARQLFGRVMAPLVLGGGMEPGHAIGARSALALGQEGAVDADLFDRVQAGRVRRAREVAPIDELGPATPMEWTMAAVLHDLLQATNPGFDGVMRRKAAARVLGSAMLALDRVEPPAHLGEALSRHTWFARLLTTRRVDTTVSWWTGSQTFRGEPPPSRLQLWPELRRVTVAPRSLSILELQPLAVDRGTLALALTRLLERTPLTDLATCARSAPAFQWSDAALALVATEGGRALAGRALRREPSAAVDEALGKATRDLLARDKTRASSAMALLGERALASALAKPIVHAGTTSSGGDFARALGATAALKVLAASPRGWGQDERERAVAVLLPLASSLTNPEVSPTLPETA